jgi:hypothetical protein
MLGLWVPHRRKLTKCLISLFSVYTQLYGYEKPYKRPVSALQRGHHQTLFTSTSDLRQDLVLLHAVFKMPYTVEPLITDTDWEFKFCPLWEVYVSWSSSSDLSGTVEGTPLADLLNLPRLQGPCTVTIAVANYFG